MSLAYIIEDDELMNNLFAEYLEGICETKQFFEVISAIQSISEDKPDLIFLDILLTGPNGFAFLNEIVSYEDTAKIPIIIITSLNLNSSDLKEYNVVKIFKKEKVMPEEIKDVAREFLKGKDVKTK